MAKLSSMTAQEISELLDQYGIKHGPVVDTTRALYEKKLRDAMINKKAKRSSERTYYREEEEVTYINHRRPLGHEDYGDRENPFSRSEYRNLDSPDEPIVFRTAPSRSGAQTHHVAPAYERRETPAEPASTRYVPIWLQILLFLFVVALLVFVFINMEPADSVKELA
ncbi:uncharacterized protein LOC143513240 [Brachyhypopomus gauderio]|uniref:uncharacterized protein LOC143513240 n=1 Tax=Brachyhypopomus gauderio TaxID=698409 RepID=UPI0040435844